MDYKKWIIRLIFKPILHKLRGWDKILRYHKFIKKHEYNSIEKNQIIQQKRLYNIIDHAVNNIPYYKNFAKENNFTYNYKTIYEDIKKLPILTKNIIREEFQNLQWQEYKGKIRENTSGGSTGEPIRLLQDEKYTMDNWTEYSDSLGKHEFGEKVISLWGSERDIIFGTENLLMKMLNKFYYRKVMINTFRMSEKDMELYVKK